MDSIKSPRRPSKLLGFCFDMADTLHMAVLIIAVISVFGVRLSGVMGYSMLPTLQNGQRILISAAPGKLEHGDIVVISEKGTAIPTGEEVIIKRVIGLPGDVIDIDFDAHIVYRNGEALAEDYINEPTAARGDMTFPLTVAAGNVFLLGDNRNKSADSRFSYVAQVDQRHVMGRMLLSLSK